MLALHDALRLFPWPADWSAQGPSSRLARRAMLRRSVRGRGAFGAIGEMFDQSRAGIGPRALGRPRCRGIDRERIVAVDAQPGDAITDRARREGGRLGPGKARKRTDRPLIDRKSTRLNSSH